jgi:molybdenum cofactor biosynthesis enzyme MoaA
MNYLRASWDGKWLNTLFRAAGLPKHALRLRDTDEALMETVRAILREAIETDELDREVETILVLAGMRRADAPAHRALPDALGERAVWIAVRDAALARLAELRPG